MTRTICENWNKKNCSIFFCFKTVFLFVVNTSSNVSSSFSSSPLFPHLTLHRRKLKGTKRLVNSYFKYSPWIELDRRHDNQGFVMDLCVVLCSYLLLPYVHRPRQKKMWEKKIRGKNGGKGNVRRRLTNQCRYVWIREVLRSSFLVMERHKHSNDIAQG